MPSRKRNQGKARKAKQQSRPPKEEKIIVSDDIEKCDHDLEIPCSLDQLKCHEFAQRFLKLVWNQRKVKKNNNDPTLEVLNAYDSVLISAAAMQYLLIDSPHIWKDNLYRKMVIKMLLKTCADKISRYSDHTISTLKTDGGVGSYAAGIIVLETSIYDERKVEEDKDMDLIEVMDVETKRKVYKFLRSSNRSIIRFFINRIKCSCLDERYAKVQSLPKMSVCSRCAKQVETSKLYLCGGCKLFQYCCVECQASAWKAEHHKICNRIGRRKSSKALEVVSASASY